VPGPGDENITNRHDDVTALAVRRSYRRGMAAGDDGSPRPSCETGRDTPTRRLHLIGSYPAPTAKSALHAVLAAAGPYLAAIPQGDTGPGRDGVFAAVRQLRGHPALEIRRDGDWSDYADPLLFAVRRGHQLRGSDLNLGYAANHRSTHALVQRLCRQHGVGDLPIQVGLPTDIELGLFALGSAGMLLQRAAFADALLLEIDQIVHPNPQGIVIQLDLPATLSLVARAPAALRRAAAQWAGSSVVRLIARMPKHTRVGLHLCVGDLAHQPMIVPQDAAPVTALANAICRQWPAGRHLEYVHAAFAAGPVPPSTDGAWYAPLRGLRLPSSTRFVVGILHEHVGDDDLAAILAAIDTALDRQVDVAAACGLGRRTVEAANRTIEQGVALCADQPRTSPDRPHGGFRRGTTHTAS
jgi:hypothetical protein